MSINLPRKVPINHFCSLMENDVCQLDIERSPALMRIKNIQNSLFSLEEDEIINIIENLINICAPFDHNALTCLARNMIHVSAIRYRLIPRLLELYNQLISIPEFSNLNNVMNELQVLSHTMRGLSFYSQATGKAPMDYQLKRLNFVPNNPMIKAIMTDDFDMFQKLSSEVGFNFDMKISISTLLWLNVPQPLIKLAAYFGSIKIFKFILLNVDIFDDSISDFAIAGGNLEIIRILEQMNCFRKNLVAATIFHHSEIYDWMNQQDEISAKFLIVYSATLSENLYVLSKFSDIHVESAYINACKKSFNELAEIFIREHPEIDKITGLPWACKFNNIDLLNLILDGPTEHINKFYQDHNGLLSACKYGHINIIKRLFEYDNLNVNIHDQDFMTCPLIESCKSNLETFKFILTHPKIQLDFDNMNNNPLLQAIHSNKVDIVSEIMNNPKLSKLKDYCKDRLLIAISSKHEEIVDLLISYQKLEQPKNCDKEF